MKASPCNFSPTQFLEDLHSDDYQVDPVLRLTNRIVSHFYEIIGSKTKKQCEQLISSTEKIHSASPVKFLRSSSYHYFQEGNSNFLDDDYEWEPPSQSTVTWKDIVDTITKLFFGITIFGEPQQAVEALQRKLEKYQLAWNSMAGNYQEFFQKNVFEIIAGLEHFLQAQKNEESTARVHRCVLGLGIFLSSLAYLFNKKSLLKITATLIAVDFCFFLKHSFDSSFRQMSDQMSLGLKISAVRDSAPKERKILDKSLYG